MLLMDESSDQKQFSVKMPTDTPPSESKESG